MSMFSKAQPEALATGEPWTKYGDGNIAMETLLRQSENSTLNVEVTEVFQNSTYSNKNTDMLLANVVQISPG